MKGKNKKAEQAEANFDGFTQSSESFQHGIQYIISQIWNTYDIK
jgi:hypothetical protein